MGVWVWIMALTNICKPLFGLFPPSSTNKLETPPPTQTHNNTGNPSVHPDGTQVFVGDEEGGLLALNSMTGESVRLVNCVAGQFLHMCICVHTRPSIHHTHPPTHPPTPLHHHPPPTPFTNPPHPKPPQNPPNPPP